ncbi:MAG: hypothetical protein IJK78_00795, partial [Bacteroidales bacterium]|nr:hypothetical protein [Bacteroidales bacterium]
VAQGRQQKKAHVSSAFFSIAARYTLAHTKAGARSGDAGNTDFPLGFYCVGCAVGIICFCTFVGVTNNGQ